MKVNIIGAGLAGLSCAITLSEYGIENRLISLLPSERAQSSLAEGGINGALDTMGENDTPQDHFQDTMKGGACLNDPEAVRVLTDRAPEILSWLIRIGVPFQARDRQPVLRKFGGQKKKRTAYAKSSTGKLIMSAMISECRRWECAGLTQRFSHHRFVRLLTEPITDRWGNSAVSRADLLKSADSRNANIAVTGVRILDTYTGSMTDFEGPVVLCSGGMGGLFPGQTTGTTLNSGSVTATVFAQGVRLGNLEMIQYHPTTMKIPGKRCLVSEAARGEGGRLFIMRDGRPWYFMDEKYPEMGSLMPRDVVSREEYMVREREDTEGSVCLDMTGIPKKAFLEKLSDLRDEIMYYLNLDPMKDPIPVEPGIHYFMGGIDVDDHHRASLKDLYAAGECCCRYHGANRLGGNSMLGALLGGRIAAESIAAESSTAKTSTHAAGQRPGHAASQAEGRTGARRFGISVSISDEKPEKLVILDPLGKKEDPALAEQVGEILQKGLGIIRDQQGMTEAEEKIKALIQQDLKTGPAAGNYEIGVPADINLCRLQLADAIVLSALERRESRGAHTRSDFPEKSDEYKKMTIAEMKNGEVQVSFRPLREEAVEG